MKRVRITDNPTETESESCQIFHAGFVVDKVALEHFSLRVLRLFVIIITPAIVYTRLPFIYHLHAVHIILETESSLKKSFFSFSLSYLSISL